MNTARLAAGLFLGVAALNSAHVTAQQTSDAATSPPAVTDPLAKELVRCKSLHEQAAADTRCQAAYKESRTRFLTPPSDYQPKNTDLYPGVPDPKTPTPKQDDTGK